MKVTAINYSNGDTFCKEIENDLDVYIYIWRFPSDKIITTLNNLVHSNPSYDKVNFTENITIFTFEKLRLHVKAFMNNREEYIKVDLPVEFGVFLGIDMGYDTVLGIVEYKKL